MTIERDGHVYELTDEEIEKASKERDFENYEIEAEIYLDSHKELDRYPATASLMADWLIEYYDWSINIRGNIEAAYKAVME